MFLYGGITFAIRSFPIYVSKWMKSKRTAILSKKKIHQMKPVPYMT